MTNSISPCEKRPPLSNSICTLPFYVRPATSSSELAEYCALRSRAYSKRDYQQSIVNRLAQVDEFDLKGLCLLAKEKGTHKLIGGMRASLSTHGSTAILKNMPLESVGEDSFVYADRFALEKHEHAPLASLALMKGIWLLAHQENVQWILGAALPGMARRYHMAGLRPLREVGSTFHAPELHEDTYTAMGARVENTPANMSPAFHQFIVEQMHPDIEGQGPKVATPVPLFKRTKSLPSMEHRP